MWESHEITITIVVINEGNIITNVKNSTQISEIQEIVSTKFNIEKDDMVIFHNLNRLHPEAIIGCYHVQNDDNIFAYSKKKEIAKGFHIGFFKVWFVFKPDSKELCWVKGNYTYKNLIRIVGKRFEINAKDTYEISYKGVSIKENTTLNDLKVNDEEELIIIAINKGS